MTKDQKIGVMWKLLFGTVTCLSFASPALSDSSKLTKTSCPGEFSKQSTLPTSYKCNMVRLPDGTMLQTVPKLFSPPAVVAGKIPCQHIICRIPDCGKNLCKNGWCEETMVGYNCTCSSGFQGRHCDEQSTKDATTKPMMSPTKTMTERSDTTTFQSTTTSAKTKSATSPTATMPERSDATTSRETTTSKSVESSTTDVATKTATRPMTTVSAATTSPETTTPTCSSPPVDCEFGGSFYNFSTAKMNHASAVSACSQYGSHLVFIESQEEEDFITRSAQYLSDLDITTYWIGLTGLSLSEARWLDGSSLTYSNFNQDSFDDNVNCFFIQCVDQYRKWHDRDCSRQLRFICEKEVGI